jgi:hypothetical protein
MKLSRSNLACKMAAAMLLGLVILLGFATHGRAENAPKAEQFVRVSPRDARYLELSDGRPFIPIGLNLCWPAGGQDEHQMDRWLERLAANGGNMARIWLGTNFFDVEHDKSGVYDQQKARRIDAIFDLARKHGIRLKLTLENFREVDPNTPYAKKTPHQVKAIHHVSQGGPAKSMDDWFSGEASREQFRRKLAWYAARYGSDPIIFGWELWNEVNATQGKAVLPWTEEMLSQLHEMFPKNLAMQSLGSLDRDSWRDTYRRHSVLPGNDLAQVHRYLDLGAQLNICHGPVDILAADAVREVLAFGPHRPVLLAEGGAVEPAHTGTMKLLAKDKAGMVLHDILFAPFFAGAAGSGQCWHWNEYVDRNDLWWHFGRFAAAVGGLDPPAEAFEPAMLDHQQLRIYVLNGRHTTLLWCRDRENTWQSELAEGIEPRRLSDVTIDLGKLAATSAVRVRVYDPWENCWSEATPERGTIRLPEFRRSIIIRIEPSREAKDSTQSAAFQENRPAL